MRNIEEEFRPTHDELARQRFIAALRKHAIVDLRGKMKQRYENAVEPKLTASGNPPTNWRDIDNAMQTDPLYQIYSSTRYNAQEMCYHSVQPTIERNLAAMVDVAKEARERPRLGGSLRLNPDLKIPAYVTQLDVHLTPGFTHKEYTEDDVAQGAVINFGGKVFTGQHPYRKSYGAVGESVSYWIKKKFPDLNPKRILDLGTCSGKNLFPYAKTFPDAELHGIDVGAPVLRFGHAFAEQEGAAVHFSQQDAENLDFEDESFDVIVSSFFFHEVPVKATQRILAACYRLLKPGGVMAHMELPNETEVSDYENFFWNWDTRNNNEPFYTRFRAQDFHQLCREAGFPADSTFANLVPDLASSGEAMADACIAGERETPPHGSGGWFVFGARKPA